MADDTVIDVVERDKSRDEQRLIDAGYNPDRYRLLSSGGVYDNERKVIAGNIGDERGRYPINHENAHEMHEKYRELRISAMQAALEQETGVDGLHPSLVILNRALVRNALQGRGIAAVKSTELIYRVMDLLDNAGPSTGGAGAGISGESLAALRDIVVAVRDMRQAE